MKTGTTFFTSDTHLGHRLVAEEVRGFSSIEEHDAAIIENWNSIVKPYDIVWHLGDVGMGGLARFLPQLKQLNGRKHLITGNHDACWPGHRDSFRVQRDWMNVFESVQPFARRRVNDAVVLLSHFPYDGDHTTNDRCVQYRLRDEGEWLLHGHTHFKDQQLHGTQLHVGMDAWGLKPVPVDIVQRLIGQSNYQEEKEGEGS